MTRDPADETGSLSSYKRLFDQAALLARIGAWECRLDTEELTWTDGVYDLFEIARGEPVKRKAIVELYEEESRRQMELMRAQTIRTGIGAAIEAQIRTARGGLRWMRLSADVISENRRPVRIFGAKQDITREREAWDRLRHLAERDALTGLANRAVFDARYGEVIRDEVDHDSCAALVLIDLDHFKAINDRYGHEAGDECLRQAAARLHRALPEASLIARIGGDEFAILLQAPLGQPRIARMLDCALKMLRRPVIWKVACIDLGASIGAALPDGRLRKPVDLFAEADEALYAAKAAGRNLVRIFGQDAAADIPASPTLRG